MLRKSTPITDEQVDRIAAEIIRAFSAEEETVADAAASPFLFSRIKANIAAQERANSEAGNIWLGLFKGLRRAVPVFALLAVFTIGGALLADNQTPLPTASSGNSLDSLLYDSSDELFVSEFALTEGKR